MRLGPLLWERSMDLIDTNVIIRYLLRDIEDQYLRASQAIDLGVLYNNRSTR